MTLYGALSRELKGCLFVFQGQCFESRLIELLIYRISIILLQILYQSLVTHIRANHSLQVCFVLLNFESVPFLAIDLYSRENFLWLCLVQTQNLRIRECLSPGISFRVYQSNFLPNVGIYNIQFCLLFSFLRLYLFTK